MGAGPRGLLPAPRESHGKARGARKPPLTEAVAPGRVLPARPHSPVLCLPFRLPKAVAQHFGWSGRSNPTLVEACAALGTFGQPRGTSDRMPCLPMPGGRGTSHYATGEQVRVSRTG